MTRTPRWRSVLAGASALTLSATLWGSVPASAATPTPAPTAVGQQEGDPRPDGGLRPGPEPTEPSLVGAAKTYRADGQDVRFAFDAHGFATAARGTFRVSHYEGGEGGWFSGRIDCLIVAGPVAVATGVVTESSFPEFLGVRKGFTVYDNGRRDRVGYSWALDAGSTESVPLCLSGAPYETLETGNFHVVEWFPPQAG
ncbi:hypothetical protein BDK92_6671 [Micromonospora pisi]|uniref:Uncharacterized protein n=1 Tax=Micromonospora pisi TaxID=589240 RepID=A0A495JUL7_9ACTN|nr:hypothetical protein [Micromonospora pisi]RKR92235.1 hypothetical protein BDK92_6671 [Micromonospora pisi]